MVSLGLVSLSGIGSVDVGTDKYTTSTVQQGDFVDGNPVVYVKVGRLMSPIRTAYFDVSAAPSS